MIDRSYPPCFHYALIFGTLPSGAWVVALSGILIAEIYFTMADFMVEITVRKPLGDVYGGERITHALMGSALAGLS